MMIVIGSPNAACGRATPSGLSSSPRLRSMMNSGRIATANGNSSPSVNSVYSELAARGTRSGRSTNAASDAPAARRAAVETSAISVLLPTWRQNVAEREDLACSSTNTHGSGRPTGSVDELAVGRGTRRARRRRSGIDDRRARDARPTRDRAYERDGSRRSSPAPIVVSGALDVAAQDEALVGEREHEREHEDHDRDRAGVAELEALEALVEHVDRHRRSRRRSGPPPVITHTRSNSCSAPMIDRKTEIRIVGPSSGSVTWRKRLPARSRRRSSAASLELLAGSAAARRGRGSCGSRSTSTR